MKNHPYKSAFAQIVIFVSALLIVFLISSPVLSMLPSLGNDLYLPFVSKAEQSVIEPTAVTPTIETPPVTATTGNIVIVSVFYDGVLGSTEPDEYVEIKNSDTKAIQVQNWKLSDAQNHVFTFPAYVMQPGQACRIYTNQNHPETCGFNYGSSAAIWNNGGDCATLKDSQGAQKDQKCY